VRAEATQTATLRKRMLMELIKDHPSVSRDNEFN
jgi:hypothetical protein